MMQPLLTPFGVLTVAETDLWYLVSYTQFAHYIGHLVSVALNINPTTFVIPLRMFLGIIDL